MHRDEFAERQTVRVFRWISTALFPLIVGGLCGVASGQQLELAAVSIDAGGLTQGSAGDLTVTVTVGQPDAASLSGDGLVFVGGIQPAGLIESPPCDPCDMNCDGVVNAYDIEPFLELLFEGGAACHTCTGDTNGDGLINAFDIEPFLNCLFP